MFLCRSPRPTAGLARWAEEGAEAETGYLRMSRTNRPNKIDEEAALRRSARTRIKHGEVLDSGIDYSSDSELSRNQRDKWSTETLLGQEDRFDFSRKRDMSRREEKSEGKDSGRGGSEQPGMADLLQMIMSENRRRDEENKRREEAERARRDEENMRREEAERIRREDESKRREEDMMRRDQRWLEQMQAQMAANASPEPRYPPKFDKHSLLRLTNDNKDLDGFITLFEAQLSMDEVPMEEWNSLLIGQLDATPRLKVAELVADAESSYDGIVRALRVCDGDTCMHVSSSKVLLCRTRLE